MKPPVLLAYVLIAATAFYFGFSRRSEEVDVKNERISFLNDQIAAYKDRLQGATPDQAAQQLALLRDSLLQYEKKFDEAFPSKARSLSSKEIESLTSRKEDLQKIGRPISIFYGLVGDSAQYATSFAEFFASQSISFWGPIPTTCKTGEKGVLIGLKNPDAPSDQAKLFTTVLGDTGLKIGNTKWSAPGDGGLDFDLFICPPS